MSDVRHTLLDMLRAAFPLAAAQSTETIERYALDGTPEGMRPIHFRRILEWSNARLAEAEAKARFEPIGDNHHNAMACPYCNPPEADTRDAEIERLRVGAIATECRNQADLLTRAAGELMGMRARVKCAEGNYEGQKRSTLAFMQENDEALAEIERLRATMTWQPIETAPKDGTRILLIRAGRIICGHWDDDQYASKPRPYWTHDWESIYGVRDARRNPPSHWTPVPQPPV